MAVERPHIPDMPQASKGLYASAAVAALLATVIGAWEGKRNLPYRDPVGVLTVCYGHTGSDIQQRPYSDEECLAILEKDIKKHSGALQCVKTELDLKQKISFISLAYNIGPTKFCGSTVVKKANAGDMAASCKAMSLWRNGRVNGKLVPLPGLVNRRTFERAICEGDWATARQVAEKVGLKELVQAVSDIEQFEAAEQETEQETDANCNCEKEKT